ncbi:sulfotransferase family protein [Pacificoceanicola onchidii]|uniref:sulfotransferase family protein n=1 Tax=Pacificoceanicola onchidii TaxID=2562685 RepID=UPI0010A4B6B5|nr:sulfotransferase [Pacificoceanicola onchidii]
MDKTTHFISGLPRSGSTLLSAILRQNPRFHAGMSSPVASLFMAMQGATSRRNETAVFLNEEQKIELLRGVFTGVYSAYPDKDVVFDTNRAWNSKLPALAQMFPEAKVICCVRNVAWIMDSIERLIRANPFELSGIFGYEPSSTVFTRVSRLAGSDGLVGYALDALREAYFGGQSDRLFLVSYEALVQDPERTLRALYDFIGEPWYPHDFNNVDYDARDFDMALGTPDLHTVRRKVEWKPRKTVLPPDLFEHFNHDAFWASPEMLALGIPTVLPEPG